MDDPTRYVGPFHSVIRKEAIDILAQILFDDIGNFRRQDNLEAALGNVPPHHAFGVWIEGRACINDLWTCESTCRPADHDGNGAVAEEPTRNQVSDGEIISLPSEGANFDR